MRTFRSIFVGFLLLTCHYSRAKQSASVLRARYSALDDEVLHYYARLSDGSQLDPKPLAGTTSHLKEILIQRAPGTENKTIVQNYIVEQFKDLGWHIEEDRFEDKTPLGRYTFTNIIVTADPSASKRLVLAAHYDSKYFPEGHEFLGATDSAVSCAILIDLAVSLNKDLERTRASVKEAIRLENGLDDECLNDTTLQFIFFDGEEAFGDWTTTDSIYGSRHLAQRWEEEQIKADGETACFADQATSVLDGIEMFVLLDLLGSQNPTIMASSYETSWAFENLIRLESRLAQSGLWQDMSLSSPSIEAPGLDKTDSKATSYRSFFRPLPTQGLLSGGIEDDHVPFMARGVPILHIIPYPFPTVWHTAGDNADAVDLPTSKNWNLLLRVFVAEYLALKSPDELSPKRTEVERQVLVCNRGDLQAVSEEQCDSVTHAT